uniref:Uncharacterized protein n=1 Tax=Globodera rostochiensis TaxID=31243 RepID=A0A914GYF9_GLORO
MLKTWIIISPDDEGQGDRKEATSSSRRSEGWKISIFSSSPQGRGNADDWRGGGGRRSEDGRLMDVMVIVRPSVLELLHNLRTLRRLRRRQRRRLKCCRDGGRFVSSAAAERC